MALITSANPRLFDFVVQFEHPVPWMYLDSRGLPTVGIGHLIGKARNASRSEAKEDALFIHHRFGFHAGGRRATDTEVITRLYSLLATPEAGHRNNLHHTHWQTRPSATPPVEMDQAGIRALKQRWVNRSLDRP